MRVLDEAGPRAGTSARAVPSPLVLLPSLELPPQVVGEVRRRFATVLTEAGGSGVLVVGSPHTEVAGVGWFRDLVGHLATGWTVAQVAPDAPRGDPDLLGVTTTEAHPVTAEGFVLAVGTTSCGVLTTGPVRDDVPGPPTLATAWTFDPATVTAVVATLLARLRVRDVVGAEHLGSTLERYPCGVRDVRSSERFAHELLTIAMAGAGTRPGMDGTPSGGPPPELDHHTQLAAVGRSAAAFAHELNNPTFAIAMAADLIRGAAAELAPPARDTLTGHAALIADQADRIGAMTRAMLDLTRTAQLDPRPIELAAWLVATAAELTTDLGHPVMAAATRSADTVTDPERLRDALRPLIVNAIEADPDRAPVVVRLTAVEDGHAIDVIDRGPGVAPEVLDELFTPFVSTKGGRGSGLGLALSRRFVRQLGGSVQLHGSDHEGATFRLWLPLDARQRDATAGGGPPAPHGVGSGRVVVLDDTEAVRTTVAALLRRRGFTVETADDAAAAERSVRQAPVDLLIADLHFAADVTLAELLERLERLQGDVRRRTVVITGDLPSAVPSLGVARVLSKPFGRVELESVVAEVLA